VNTVMNLQFLVPHSYYIVGMENVDLKGISHPTDL
jgi:hypothetical protein